MLMTILKKKLEKLITISEKVNIIRNMRIINHITQETMANYLHYTRIEYNRKERQNEYNLYIYLKLSILYNINISYLLGISNNIIKLTQEERDNIIRLYNINEKEVNNIILNDIIYV